MTKQEELYRLKPPNGARPKWNRLGRPLPVIEEPRGPGAEATGGMDSPIEMGGGSPSVVPPPPPVSGARRSGRGMRPAGGNSRSSRKLNVVSTSEVEKMDSLDSRCPYQLMRRCSFPEAMPSGGAPIEEGPESYRDYVPPREMAGGIRT